MEINVNVVNQKLHITTNLKSLVAGTQEFIKFNFNLGDDWDNLLVSAQFMQNGTAYNKVLDSNDSCYLPAEIVAGTCSLMLFGSGTETHGTSTVTVRATTNLITFNIDVNHYISDASSTEITQSLYDQLVDMVNAVLDISDNADYAQLIQDQVAAYLAQAIEDHTLDALSIGDGSVTKAKLSSGVQESLDKADNSWQKNQSTSGTPTTGSWEATYDPNGYARDVFSYIISQDTNTIQRIRGTNATVNNGTQIFILEDVAGNTYTYTNGLDAVLNGILQRAENFATSTLADYSPFSVTIVNSLPEEGAERTFYLVPKDSGYEKYWYIQDENNNYVWDSFGSSSTLVVSTLPQTGEEDVDYIVGSGNDYQYYKYINGSWKLIAGNSAEIISLPTGTTLDGSGSALPTASAENADDYFLLFTDMKIYHCAESSGSYSWEIDSTLISNPSPTKDYYIPNENDVYLHFRYIGSAWELIGSDAYSKSEIDAFLNAISGDVSDIASDVNAINTYIDNLANMVKEVSISNDKTTLTITYMDNSTSTIELDTGVDIDSTAYNVDGDYTLHFYDSNGNELEDLAVEIQGGGGGGAVSGGTVTIGRVTGASVQTVYGDECVIQYTVIATDSSNEGVGDGVGTLYINNVAVESGFTVFTSTLGASNSIDVSQYLSVGTNTVKISVSVDTGGESNTVATKTWSVNAVNMYFTWQYTDSQVNTSAVTDYYTPYGALSKTIYTFIDVEPVGFNPVIVTELPSASDEDFDATANYFLYDSTDGTYTHYVYENNAYVSGTGSMLDVTSTTRSGVQQALTIPMQTHGSHTIVRYMEGVINGETITTAQQAHDMVFVVAGTSTPIIATSFNTATMVQYNTVQIPIVVYDPSNTTATVILKEDGATVSTWTGVDRTVHYWNYSPTTYGTKTLTITCGATTKTITINVTQLSIDESEVTGYDFRFKASELATNAAAQAWTGSYTPVGSNTAQTVDITFSNNFDWVNGGLHTETDEDGHLRQYFCVRAGTTMTFNYPLFGNAYDPKQYGKNFKFVFKAVNCRTYDAQVLSCMDSSVGNNGVGLVMTANNAVLNTVNETLDTYYCKDTYIEFETNIHPTSEYRYLQFWMDGSHDRNILYSSDDGMQQVSPVGITIGSPNCDVYVYMVKAYPTYLTNDNELSNFIMDAPNAYEMVDRYDRNDILNASGEIDYTKLAAKNPDLRVILLDLNRMSTGKKDNVVAFTARQIYNSGGASHCFTINNACVTIQGTSSVGYLESAGNMDINFKYNREFTSDNVTYTTSSIAFDDGTTSTGGYSMNENSIAVDYLNIKVNVASSENANNACIADWYNTYQPWRSPAKKKNSKARDTIEFVPGVVFIRDRSGDLFSDTTGYHMYGICDIGNSKKNTKVFHDTKNPIACCVEVANNTSLPCLMSSKTYTWNSKNEATIIEDGEEQKVYEFRYEGEHVDLAKTAWDRFVAFMYDHNPNLATGNNLSESVTFGSYTFKGSGTYNTSAYDSSDYTVCYLYGYGLPAANGYAASSYVSDTSGEDTCYYYINYSNNYIYSSDGTSWTAEEELTWTADTGSVLRGVSVDTYAGTYTKDTFDYRMAYLLAHCEEYLVIDPTIYHFIFIESFLMTDNVAKNTFWSSDDLVHWEPSKDYDNDPYPFHQRVIVKHSLIHGEGLETVNA